MVIGDAIASTGFARVLHSLLERLCDRYEFHHVGVNYYGDPHDLGWKIYPAGAEGDHLGTNRIHGLLDLIGPDLVFCLNDLWVLTNYMDRLREVESRPRVLMYSPVDAGPVAAKWIKRLEGIDQLVAYTEFGKGELEKAVELLREDDPDFEFPPVAVVPHGVDTHRFYPIDPSGDGFPVNRTAARLRLLPEKSAFVDGFVVLNANRNQPRKRIDVTLKGFALFARDKPENVFLYLHMGVEDVGWDVKTLARRYGIEDRLILTSESHSTPGVSDEILNQIYNCCDVGLNTSLGEGWGLVSLEHAATGAAQVVPNHSACEEIWTDSAILLEPSATLVAEGILTEGRLVSPEEVAAALEKLYSEPALLKRMSHAAFDAATRSDYQWPQIAEKWNLIFQEVLRPQGQRSDRVLEVAGGKS